MLGISVNYIGVMAYRMGLKKDPEYLSDVNRRCGSISSSSKNWKSQRKGC